MQQTIRVASAMALASGLLLTAVLCAPQQQLGAPKQLASTTVAATTSSTTAATAASSGRQAANEGPASTAGQATSNQQQQQQLLQQQRSNLAAPVRLAAEADEQQQPSVGVFDGKNPFGDDSLWQIPIHLVRDLDSKHESMHKSASAPAANQLVGEEAYASGLDDDDDSGEPLSSVLPTLISASTSLPAGTTETADLKTAAGYHHATPHHGGYGHHGSHHSGHNDYHGKYYQYASVPYPYAWDFGYRRGNPYHTIERHEHGKGPHFQTKVKWSDKYGGYGVHVWDYNHDDHHAHHYEPEKGHYDSHHGYGGHAGHHYGHH